jgi:hypothetical protein
LVDAQLGLSLMRGHALFSLSPHILLTEICRVPSTSPSDTQPKDQRATSKVKEQTTSPQGYLSVQSVWYHHQGKGRHNKEEHEERSA